MSDYMYAATTNDQGGFDYSPVAMPSLAPGEVLIKSAGAGVNPADWAVRDPAIAPDGFAQHSGAILGWDVAGTVVAVDDVTRFAVGDQVFGMPRFPEQAAAYAEFVAAPAADLAAVPPELGLVEAAALPLAGLTAWQALVSTADLSSGQRVLIHAASGGVGHLAVQIAKARGAEVFGTASAHNHEELRSLGADHLIDYRTESFEDVCQNIDTVLVAGGGAETAKRSVAVVRPGGHLVAIAAPLPDESTLEDAGVVGTSLFVHPDMPGLEALAGLVQEGRLRVVIGESRPLAHMEELHAIGQQGGPLGKLVATIVGND